MTSTPAPDSAVLMEIFRRAHLAMIHSLRTSIEIKSGRLRMSFHSPRGQEIIPASVSVQLSNRDYLVTIYRGSHDLICKGVPLHLLWAEYAGRMTGVCKGKGGPMHITYPACGAMATTGVVGSGLPIANGLGLSSRLKGDGRVTVCTFGDGASNIGAFHEALNLASLWKLPVIFLCQNNRYAEHTSYAAGTSIERIAERAGSYSMPGITVNGNDPIAMWKAAKEAIERARSNGGPSLIEALTFRLSGHGLGDDSHYIPKAEMENAIKDDPVPLMRRFLIENGFSCESAVVNLEATNGRLLEEAVAFAYDSAYPDASQLRRDVLAKEVS